MFSLVLLLEGRSPQVKRVCRAVLGRVGLHDLIHGKARQGEPVGDDSRARLELLQLEQQLFQLSIPARK